MPANPEPELSQHEVARLRRLLHDTPAKQGDPQTACKNLHEVGAELHGINARLELIHSSINARLDLMQRIFAGSALTFVACLGYLFIKSTDLSVSVGKIETKLVAIDERFDGVDQRFDGVDKRLDGVDKRLDGVDKRLDGIDQRLNGIDQRLGGLERRFDGLDSRLDTITALLTPPKIQQQ